MPRAPKTTYADRTLFQLLKRSAGAFFEEELVQEVIDMMRTSGESVTRASASWVRRHIKALRFQRLIRKDREDPEQLQLSKELRTEYQNIRARGLRFGPAELKKMSSLVQIGAYPRKKISPTQLRERCIEAEDERDVLEDRCNALQTKCDNLEAQLSALKNEQARTHRDSEEFMDVDGEDGNATSSKVTLDHLQGIPGSLRRIPTEPVIPPITPMRNSSSKTQFPPTPPTTEDRPKRQFSHNGSRARGRSFCASDDDVSMHESDESPTRPRPRPQREASKMTVRAPSFQDPGPFPSGDSHSQAKREQDLEREVERLKGEIAQLTEQVADGDRQLQEYEAEHLDQTRRYQELQENGDALRARIVDLRRDLEYAVEKDAEILTLANQRIAEQTGEATFAFQTVHQLMHGFMHVWNLVPTVFHG